MKTTHLRRRSGFTLIELMAVITIIVILAGLVVGGMGFVNERQAKEKVKVQMALIEKALEEYKLDNGEYPPTANSSSGSGTSDDLFNALFYVGFQDDTGNTKIYLPELDPETNKQGWTSGNASKATKIQDPWGNDYRYRTATGKTGNTNSNCQNPDFDLWSVGKDTKTRAGRNDKASHNDNKDDIRNF